LEDGRGLILLREAHVRKLIDFREAKFLDRNWWLSAGWVLEWLEKELYGEVYGLKYALHLALLEYALEQRTFDLHWEQAQDFQARIIRHKLPWLKIEHGPSQQEVKSMAAKWAEIFGDPNDPEVAQKIEATAAALRSGAAVGLDPTRLAGRVN
jgi:hypothetical protein